MNNELKFNTNKVDLQSIYSYLLARNEDFTPPLSDKLNVHEFARKMYNNANIYTVSDKSGIIGLAGCYSNNLKTLEAYITNISIHPDYFGTGLADELIKYCINDVQKKGFQTIKLEVHKNNNRAINFYKKMGFQIIENETKSTSLIMLKTLSLK